MEAAVPDRDLHRATGLRTPRIALVGCRPQAPRASRPAARRPLQRDRRAEDRGGNANAALAAAGDEHLAGVEADLSEGRARSGFSEWRRQHRGALEYRAPRAGAV